MKITVVGTGYVGLVTGCCLAELGHSVTCIDNDEQKVNAMKNGVVPIFEPGLEHMVHKNTKRGKLTFTTSLAEGVKEAAAIFLALPTPPTEDGSADLSAVLAVAKELGSCLPDHYCVVINKSTVPVGTAETIEKTITKIARSKFDVVSNPEFLREGFAIKDFMEPERVVVGVDSRAAKQIMHKLYAPITNKEHPLFLTDTRTAELTKYAANTFLVTKISFMNEIAQLCERMGADVDLVRQAIGADSRIGTKFLYPGIGCGGSCFPKDVRALKHMSEQHNYEFKLLTAAMTINDQQKHILIDKLLKHFDNKIDGRTFTIWGLAFKPGTDDIREAPALVIIDELLRRGARVNAYDPEAATHVARLYKDNKNVRISKDKYEALEKSSGLIIATEWKEFKDSNLAKIADKLSDAVIFDGRNIFKPTDMQAAGFTYYSIGRQPVQKRDDQSQI